MRIYKYPVPIEDEFVLRLPAGARVLTVQNQYESPTLWALVDETQDLVERTFHLHGTGHVVHPEAAHYVGTFQLMGGSIVFHLFEEES